MNKFFAFAIVCLSFLAVSAQNTDDYKKTEFYVGYSSHIVVDDAFFVSARGFSVAGVYNFSRRLGIKGDVSMGFDKAFNYQFVPGFGNPTNASVSYRRRDSVYNYVGGIQFKNNSVDKRVKPFAHAMAGVGQNRIKVTNVNCTTNATCASIPLSETNTGLSVIVGGGLDVKVSDTIDLRVFQLDLNSISYNRSPAGREGATTLRFGAGIVFK